LGRLICGRRKLIEWRGVRKAMRRGSSSF
jgi:hypothetical protein